MSEFIAERIIANKNIFSEEELLQLRNINSIIIKIYLLGLLDGENRQKFWLHFDYILNEKCGQNEQYGLKNRKYKIE